MARRSSPGARGGEFSPGGLKKRPFSSPSKCQHVQKVNIKHVHDKSLHQSMPELVAEEESKDKDKEDVQPKSRREQIIAEVCSLNR